MSKSVNLFELIGVAIIS